MVRRSPDVLAAILSGSAPARFGPYGPEVWLEPEQVATLVLWTRDPRPLREYPALRRAVENLLRSGTQIVLQVTLTGLAGSFLEPGMPRPAEVVAALGDLIREGWVNQEAILFRYDPFLRIRTRQGHDLSNARLELFLLLLEAMAKLGIKRVITSRADVRHYPNILRRLEALSLSFLPIPDAEALELTNAMRESCLERGLTFSVCCDPVPPLTVRGPGCIDAHSLNRLRLDGRLLSERLHNEVGKQRPECECTVSRDIGYSSGVRRCYSGGYGCLYCYAQGRSMRPANVDFEEELASFDRDPVRYLEERGLPALLRCG